MTDISTDSSNADHLVVAVRYTDEENFSQGASSGNEGDHGKTGEGEAKIF